MPACRVHRLPTAACRTAPCKPAGAALGLDGAAASVPLYTSPLEVTLSGVTSEAATNATDGLWSATVGMADDGLPEVPPGGECPRCGPLCMAPAPGLLRPAARRMLLARIVACVQGVDARP